MERRLRPRDLLKCNQARLGSAAVSVLVKFSRAPGAASKAIPQLSCWHQTAFHSAPCQIPSAAHFSSLRKPKGLSPRASRSAQAHQQLRLGAARLSACWELQAPRGRSGECSPDAASLGSCRRGRSGECSSGAASLGSSRGRGARQRLWAEPQPLPPGDALPV